MLREEGPAGKGIVCAEAWSQAKERPKSRKTFSMAGMYCYEEIMRLMRKQGQMKGPKAMLSH